MLYPLLTFPTFPTFPTFLTSPTSHFSPSPPLSFHGKSRNPGEGKSSEFGIRSALGFAALGFAALRVRVRVREAAELKSQKSLRAFCRSKPTEFQKNNSSLRPAPFGDEVYY